MQNSILNVLNLVDLFSSAPTLEAESESYPLVEALEALMTNDAALQELADMLEHTPSMSSFQIFNLLTVAALRVPGTAVSLSDDEIVEHASLNVSKTKKASVKPSWDTFSKARPIIIKSNAGVFM